MSKLLTIPDSINTQWERWGGTKKRNLLVLAPLYEQANCSNPAWPRFSIKKHFWSLKSSIHTVYGIVPHFFLNNWLCCLARGMYANSDRGVERFTPNGMSFSSWSSLTTPRLIGLTKWPKTRFRVTALQSKIKMEARIVSWICHIFTLV